MVKLTGKMYLSLIDSGATVSAIHQKVVTGSCISPQQLLQSETVGANGTPLSVVGQATLPVTLRSFLTQQHFIVVSDLFVDCLLGADFLVSHKVVIDCGERVLHIGGVNGKTVSFTSHDPLPHLNA